MPVSDTLRLQKMIKSGAMTGTLLFTGPNEEEKSQFAMELVKGLFGPEHVAKIDSGNHPDLHILTTEGKSGLHSLATLKERIEEMGLPPYEAPCKVVIIHDAERMQPAGSNALLKTLEEPPLYALIILLSSEPKDLLPTIVSRCRIFRFDFTFSPTPNEKLVQILSTSQDHAQFFKACDELEESLGGEEDNSPQKMQKLEALHEQILYWYRDLHLLAVGGDKKYLYHRNFLSQLETAREKELPKMEKLFSLVEKGRLGSHRYIRLRHVLEYILP